MPARRPLILLLSAFALLPAACGGGEDTVDEPNADPTTGGESAEDTGSGGAAAEGTVEIVMKGFQFDPSEVTVKVGQEISWRNEDSAEHDAFSEKDGLDTADIGQGATTEYTPDKAGTINYICSIHPQMKGTLIVEE